MREISESDWKVWRRLAPILLDRFCANVVNKAATFASSAGTGHEQFLALYRSLEEANDDIRAVFDDRRRSTAIFQIAGAVSRGIISAEDLEQFSPELRDRVRTLVELGG